MTQENTTQQKKPRGRVSRFFGQYLVKNRFQFKFSFMIFAFLAIAMGVIWFQGHWMIGRMIENGIVAGEEAVTHLKVLNQNILYVSVLALAVVFGMSLFFSHFVAGPLYRFEKTFEQMRDGDLSVNVRLRKYDELKDTAECFNQALMSLRSKIRHEREVLSIVTDKVRKVAEESRQAGREDQAKLLDQVLSDLQKIPTQLKI